MLLLQRFKPFKRQLHEMIKQTQTIRQQEPKYYLNVFDHFIGLVLKKG